MWFLTCLAVATSKDLAHNDDKKQPDWSSRDILPSEEGSLVRTQLGLPLKGHVIAVGHFTADRRLDCAILDESRTVVTIWLQRTGDGRYGESGARATCPAGHEVVTAMMADYDHDGYADLLLSYREAGKGDNNMILFHTLFLGDGETLVRAISTSGKGNATSGGWDISPSRGQVATVDWDGGMHLSLIGTSSISTSLLGQISVWRNRALSPDQRSTGLESPKVLSEFGRLPTLPFILQGDFNGDGRTDLFFAYSDRGDSDTNGMEVWIRRGKHEDDEQNSTSPYMLALRHKLPAGSGPVTVADVDGDGLLDVVVAVCNPVDNCALENSIHIYFNVQRGFCTGNRDLDNLKREIQSRGECRNDDRLFLEDAKESFDFDVGGNSPHHIAIPIDRLFPTKPAAGDQSKESPQPQKNPLGDDLRIIFKNPLTEQPIAMGVGDYDLDSYSDLVVVVGNRLRPHLPEENHAVILRSIPCTAGLCQEDQVKIRRRTLQAVTRQVTALTEIGGVVGVAFADWQVMGPPGFIVNFVEKENGTSGKLIMHAASIKNEINQDAFSLRAETLNGVCPAPCRATSSGSRAERPLAVNYVGANYLFSYVDEQGLRQVRAGTQLVQTMNNALLSPTSLFGLGRTSNFIHTIEVALTGRFYSECSYGKPNIFPNSEILFIPPHADSGSQWRAELQIHPAEYILYVIGSVSVALIVLAAITAVFKWQEMREDEAERKRATHLINFDAL